MKKLLKTTKFPACFDTKVDMKKIKLDVMMPWVSQQVEKLLGFDDDVLIAYIEVCVGRAAASAQLARPLPAPAAASPAPGCVRALPALTPRAPRLRRRASCRKPRWTRSRCSST